MTFLLPLFDIIQTDGAMIQIGDRIPEILGIDQDGNEVKRDDYRGRKIALYFYPKTILRDVRHRHAACATVIAHFVLPATKSLE